MIKKSIIIPIFNWAVNVIVNVTANDLDDLQSDLAKSEIPEDTIKNTIESLSKCPGIQLSGPGQSIWIITGNTVTCSTIFEVLGHEINHAIFTIKDRQNLDEEALSYITGFIWRRMYDFGVISGMIANHSGTADEFINRLSSKSNQSQS